MPAGTADRWRLVSGRGGGLPMSEMERQHREVLDETRTVTTCGRCPDWRYVGTAADGRDAFADHREAVHPTVRGRRKRADEVAARIAAAAQVAAMHDRREGALSEPSSAEVSGIPGSGPSHGAVDGGSLSALDAERAFLDTVERGVAA